MKNKIKQGCIILLVMLSGQSCNSWFDIYPENLQSTDNFWKSKEEVESVLMGTYTQLRLCNERFLQWGELRGDGMILTSTTSDAAKVKDMTLLTITNSVSSWTNIYGTIARANSVIKFGPGVLDKDVTMTKALSDSYVAEAIFIRTLCYFYLLRTFGNVPLVLEPYADDSQPFSIPVTKKEVIMEQMIADLTAWADKAKPGYEVVWHSKGRATRYACYALLADLHLWEGNYQKVIELCNLIPEDKYSLTHNMEWFSIYYPGNSDESIFELQYSYRYEQFSGLYGWTYSGDYRISDVSRGLFEDNVTEADVRGAAGSYLIVGPAADSENKIWKYAGTDVYGKEGWMLRNTNDANWVVYRYAEILLMKAEAYVMLGDNATAYALLNKVRLRAGHTIALPIAATKRDCLVEVMNERQREFIAEGKRWFDILRVAIRNNYEYRDYLTDILLAPISAKDRPVWESKLSDSYSFYLPINKTEITRSNGVLVQNPFYAGQD